MHNIEISPSALKSLERLQRANRRIAERIIRVIDSLRADPLQGKKLMGDLSHFRSLRAAEYRIIYSVMGNLLMVKVIKIAHRRDVYRI